MIQFKEGVRLTFPLRPELERILIGIETLWPTATYGPAVVTSGNDGRHMTGSCHYENRAIDLRSKSLKTEQEKAQLVEALRGWLGPDYDVILEHLGEDNEHVHVEADGKKGRASA